MVNYYWTKNNSFPIHNNWQDFKRSHPKHFQFPSSTRFIHVMDLAEARIISRITVNSLAPF